MGILKIILNLTVADQKAISRVILAECAINCWHHDSKSLLDSPPSFLPSFLDAAPWLFSLLCHFARLFFWILCSQMCFMLRSPRPWDYSCCSLTPWCVIVAEGVFSCICFPSVVGSLTHSMLLGVQEPPVGPAWGPSCHQSPPTHFCMAVGEARGAECTMC